MEDGALQTFRSKKKKKKEKRNELLATPGISSIKRIYEDHKSLRS
jgi:hypothetical protein